MTNRRKSSPEVILITGASGLIGTALCHALAKDYRVVGLDVASPDDDELPIDHIDTDLTDDDSVRKAIGRVGELCGERIASVVHLAAYYDFSGEPSPMYQELTVEGTRRLLRELRRAHLEVEQFVFSSSLLVMQPDDDGRISELSPTRAEWAYPESKLEAEQVIRTGHGGVPYVLLRIAGVYNERCHSLPISQQIARIYERQLESYVFPGDASHGQALIHLDDLVRCIRKVVERRGELPAEECFLIAEPDLMSYEELQDSIGELIYGREWPTLRIPKVVAKVGAYAKDKLSGEDDKPFIKPWMIDLADAHYAVDISHARGKLAWEPRHRLQETLPAMIASLLQNPREFYERHNLPQPDELPEQAADPDSRGTDAGGVLNPTSNEHV